MAAKTRKPRGKRAAKKKVEAVAVAPMPVVEPENLPAVEPPPPVSKEQEPPPEPKLPPMAERDWKATAEVSEELGITRATLGNWVGEGYIVGLETGKQGQRQQWSPQHIEIARRMQSVLAVVRSLSGDMKKVAAACNVEHYRRQGRAVLITPKGMRILEGRQSINMLLGLSHEPIIVVPTSTWPAP